ncbi:MAG: alpha-ketoglutarate-dependent dioxygenase AlkB [Saprospiraceae bacterium]
MKLPLHCEVEYLKDFINEEESAVLYNTLMNEYKLDKARITIEAGGKLIKTDSYKILFSSARLIKQNSHPEEIHGKSYVWSGVMAELKEKVERYLNREFEIAMCLYYPDGNFFAPYHSDQETSGINTILPSLSLGEVRQFSFKPKEEDKESYQLDLANGSLLIMGAYCQSRYVHSLPQNPVYKNGRINITFREPNFC